MLRNNHELFKLVTWLLFIWHAKYRTSAYNELKGQFFAQGIFYSMDMVYLQYWKNEKVVEEAALKSYTGFQALRAATWPVLVAFPKRQEQSLSGLRTCSAIGNEHESSHAEGFCNGHITVMREFCSAIACIGNVFTMVLLP